MACFLCMPLIGVLSLISIIGLGVNIFILAIVLRAKGGGRLFLSNLAFLGTLLSILFLATASPALLKGEPFIPCYITGTLFLMLHPLALFTVSALNFQKYLIIAKPFSYKTVLTRKSIAAVIAFAWLTSSALAVLPLFFVNSTDKRGLQNCSVDLNERVGFAYAAIYALFGLIIPTVMTIIWNIKVHAIAKDHRRRIAQDISTVQSAAVKVPSSNIANVFQVIGSMILLYSPYYFILLWVSSGKGTTEEVREIVAGLISLTPLANSILYGINDKIVKNAVKKYTRERKTRNQLKKEIELRPQK